MNKQFEMEMQALEDDYENGLITLAEYNKSVNALNREVREAIEEQAQSAADAVRDYYG